MTNENNTQQNKRMNHKRLFGLLILVLVIAVVGFFYDRNVSVAPPTTAPVSQEEMKNQEVVLIIERIDGSISKRIMGDLPEDTTAFDLFMLGDIKIEYEDYSFGKLITAIDAIKSTDGMYWIFYINGEHAQVGADSYVVQPGDEIRWRYEENIYK